ncbi:MAG TPA: dienelactone hydrolase family protein [Dehalococcoidia bacterium]|jgi:carboxymethylenebutenolidase|nr:dienelactone hydrolase family protein [Dehalococcoidia bacterium]
MAYTPITTNMLTIRGHNGDEIEAYYGQPQGNGPFPGVVVIHHGPGWDPWTGEVVCKLAQHGFATISPHLYHRYGPGSPDDAAARQRAAGGAPDDAVQGDIQGAADYLHSLPQHNGKVGIIGFCFGGRQAYLGACLLQRIDAAVDCWGGSVIADDPTTLTPARPVAPIDYTDKMSVPLLGIFGNDDANPDPDQVNRTEEKLKSLGKTYEFHRYDGAGHGFFAVDRAGYRAEQATDAWQKVFAFYGKYLSS